MPGPCRPTPCSTPTASPVRRQACTWWRSRSPSATWRCVPACTSRSASQEGAGCHVSLHGGGFTGGSVDDPIVDALSRQRSLDAGVVVVSVDYRLAPAAPLPGAARGLLRRPPVGGRPGRRLGRRPGQPLRRRRLRRGEPRCGLHAAHPRARRGAAGRSSCSRCHSSTCARAAGAGAEYARGYGLDTDDLDVAISSYLAHPDQAEEPHASPCAAPDLTGLPPAHVMTAELDPVRDGGEHYARRLQRLRRPDHAATAPRPRARLTGLTRVWAPARSWQAEATEALRAAHARPVPTAGHHDGGRR